MEIISDIFGEGKNLSISQMCFRAALIFLITLLLIHVSGRRTFGIKSPFDNIIVILLGAILSRPIVGASEFVPTIAAALTIACTHRFFAWLGLKNKYIGYLIKGRKIVLYENGNINEKNMKKALLSEKDLYSNLRRILNTDSLKNIKSVYMECNGEISFVKKDE